MEEAPTPKAAIKNIYNNIKLMTYFFLNDLYLII